MGVHRESWYSCTFRSKGHELRKAVLAWSREEAEARFQQDVRLELDERGTITVESGVSGPGRRPRKPGARTRA
jgi:hypothetical protein